MRILPDQLITPRLLLREPVEADARLIFDSYTQDEETARYMVWRPHTELRQTEAFITDCIRMWASGERQPYVLTLHGDEHQPIGMLEARVRSHKVELGYVLAKAYWGKGLMPEAVRALSDMALSIPQLFRIEASCDVDNHASARTLEKAGFTREGQLERYCIHPNISPDPRPSFVYGRCR